MDPIVKITVKIMFYHFEVLLKHIIPYFTEGFNQYYYIVPVKDLLTARSNKQPRIQKFK